MQPWTRRQFLGAAVGVALSAGLPSVPASGLSINPRSSWGADLPPLGPLPAEDVRFLIVHHSASHNGHGPEDVPSILRGWYRFHTEGRGWNDIAYNFVIDSAGGVWEGRKGSLDGPVAGDATGGNQGFTQLVCVIGDTNLQPATPEAHSSLVQMLSWLADRYGVSTSPGATVTFTSRGSNRWPEGTAVTTPTIAGHRDMSRTSCPGDSLYDYVVGSLTADVESARGGGALPPPTTAATTATTAPTTTTLPSTTTTVPSTTTTLPSTTTTMASTTSTLFAVPTTPPPPSTVPLVAASQTSSPSSALMPAFLATTGAVTLAGAGLVAWRYRRLRGGR